MKTDKIPQFKVKYTKASFIKLYKNKNHTLKDLSQIMGFSVTTVRKYAEKYGLSRGSGNRSSHRKLIK